MLHRQSNGENLRDIMMFAIALFQPFNKTMYENASIIVLNATRTAREKNIYKRGLPYVCLAFFDAGNSILTNSFEGRKQ